MDEWSEPKPNVPEQPPFEKGVPPTERPDSGPEQDQKFPETPEEGEAKPVPDMGVDLGAFRQD